MATSTQPQFARGDDGITQLRTGQKPQEDRSGLVPRFFILRRAKEDGHLSEIECVEIIVPGDTKTVSIRKVTDRERQMFPGEYEAFKKGEGFEIEGTSLELWLGRDDPRIPELRYHKVMTVEMMAELSDTQIQGLGMGYRVLRDQAKMFVAQRTGPDAMMAQNEELKVLIRSMQTQLDALSDGEPGVGDANESGGTVLPETVTGTETGATGTVTAVYTVHRGFAGQYQVKQGDDGDIVHSETGAGAKERCDQWVAKQG